MNVNEREWAPLIIAALLIGRCAVGQGSFSPAYVHVGDRNVLELTLYPADGPELTVPLPGLNASFRVIAFGPDGRSIYLPNGRGLTEIEFNPIRQTLVPGSEQFSAIWSLTVAQRTGRLLVWGTRTADGEVECGAFEIDPIAGRVRTLWRGTVGDCGGPVSPTSSLMLHSVGNRLDLVDLSSSSIQTVLRARAPVPASWSPDGRWISAVQDGSLLLIDAKDTSRRQKLGRSASDTGAWSPDAKRLLFIKSQFSCFATLFFQSLEVLDVQTRKRTWVKAAHCSILVGPVGWLDRGVVQ